MSASLYFIIAFRVFLGCQCIHLESQSYICQPALPKEAPELVAVLSGIIIAEAQDNWKHHVLGATNGYPACIHTSIHTQPFGKVVEIDNLPILHQLRFVPASEAKKCLRHSL